MEEILLFVIQFIFEVVLEVILELPFDFFSSKRSERASGDYENEYLVYFLALLLGFILGTVTLLVAPNSLVKSGVFRIANLIVAPIVSYAVAKKLGKWRLAKGKNINPIIQARAAFIFTLSLTGLRFIYVGH